MRRSLRRRKLLLNLAGCRVQSVALLHGVELGPHEIGLLFTDGTWAVSRRRDEMIPRDPD